MKTTLSWRILGVRRCGDGCDEAYADWEDQQAVADVVQCVRRPSGRGVRIVRNPAGPGLDVLTAHSNVAEWQRRIDYIKLSGFRAAWAQSARFRAHFPPDIPLFCVDRRFLRYLQCDLLFHNDRNTYIGFDQWLMPHTLCCTEISGRSVLFMTSCAPCAQTARHVMRPEPNGFVLERGVLHIAHCAKRAQHEQFSEITFGLPHCKVLVCGEVDAYQKDDFGRFGPVEIQLGAQPGKETDMRQVSHRLEHYIKASVDGTAAYVLGWSLRNVRKHATLSWTTKTRDEMGLISAGKHSFEEWRQKGASQAAHILSLLVPRLLDMRPGDLRQVTIAKARAGRPLPDPPDIPEAPPAETIAEGHSIHLSSGAPDEDPVVSWRISLAHYSTAHLECDQPAHRC